MSIPAPTTTVQLLTPGTADTTAEDWGGAPASPDDYEPLGDPVRAHLSAPTGGASAAPGAGSSTAQMRLVCDPCPMAADMLVRDLTTGLDWQVDWAVARPDPYGLDHVLAGISRVVATT